MNNFARVVAVAMAALLLTASIGAFAHEHPDRPGSECRICESSGAGVATPPAGPELPLASEWVGEGAVAQLFVADAPKLTGGIPRAPPA